MNKLKISCGFIAVVLLIFSCSKDEEVFVPKVLEASELTLSRSSSELQTFLGLSGLNVPISELVLNIEVYNVTYKTTYKGNTINASGLVILPQTSTAVGMISFQHGTIAKLTEAPSALPNSSNALILYSALASPGFIVAVPDFIGFGASSDVLHPYFVEEATTSAITDMLIAAKELAKQKSVNFNGKLFLAGYSQGGYATMATHKYIEKSGLTGFNLIASFPASGGYDLKAIQEYFFSQTIYEQPFYMAYVVAAYKDYYNWTQPLTNFFKDPYASSIPALFDGTKSGDEINAALTQTVADFVTPDILASLDTDPQYTYILTAFSENSLTDWKPSIKMFMYHGDADIWVPASSSVSTYNKLIGNGASPSILTLTTFAGKTHSTGVVPYIEAFIPKILELR